MGDIKKVYRVFISSTTRLLQKEREFISKEIIKNEMFPIQMEYSLAGPNEKLSIELDKSKIEEADGMICILSYLYGEIIGKKIGKVCDCPLRNKNDNECCAINALCSLSKNECSISFTEFEYEYAKKLGKPVFVLFNKQYNDNNAFNAEASKHMNDTSLVKAYYSGQEKNAAFIKETKQYHCYPFIYNSTSESDSFEEQAREVVKDVKAHFIKLDSDSNNAFGLVPYKLLKDANEDCALLRNKIGQSVDNIFKSQDEAIATLLKESESEDIYLDKDGKVAPIRVLAIRGVSFIRKGLGHNVMSEWSQFTLPDYYNGKGDVPVEYVLGDSENEELIKNRYSSFTLDASSDFERFMDQYKTDMKEVHDKIFDYRRRGKPCKLFLHNEERLPFRLIFIGRYVYLSTFSHGKKATQAPVIRIPSTSTLYTVCEEYYNWIKNNANEVCFE